MSALPCERLIALRSTSWQTLEFEATDSKSLAWPAIALLYLSAASLRLAVVCSWQRSEEPFPPNADSECSACKHHWLPRLGAGGAASGTLAPCAPMHDNRTA